MSIRITGLLVFMVFADSLFAHAGPRIWLNVSSGRVVTYAGPYPPAAPSQYQPARAFAQPLSDVGEDIWEAGFPGFQQVPGGAIPAGTVFRYTIAGPLLRFVPAAATTCATFETVSVHFAAMPPIPQMAVTNELAETRYTSSGIVEGDLAFVFNTTGDHDHLTYTLLGDGVSPGGGADGIYAIPLQLRAIGYQDSDIFYLLLHKNAPAEDIADAMSVILNPRVRPDLDCDGDVDLEDLGLLSACRTGPLVPLGALSPELAYCVRADFDGDLDVDQDDFGVYQRCFSGAAPSNASCDD